MSLPLGLEDLDRELHDARLDLGSVERTGDQLRVSGTIERPTGDRPVPLLGRYPVVFTVLGVEDVAIEDDEGVGELFVEVVSYDSGVLRLESAVPGRLLVRASSPRFELQVAEEPTQLRRWGRWRAVER